MSGSQLFKLRARIQWMGLFCGPALALFAYWALPNDYVGTGGERVAFTHAGRATLAIMVWMAVWWITEALDISVTALLPLVLFPLTGTLPMAKAAAPYAHPMIFLFMGGFLIAIAMQRWHLDRRVALQTLRIAGTRPANMVAGFMLTTAGLSAFVSNTATTAMMVPIALSVVHVVQHKMGADQRQHGQRQHAKASDNLAVCLLLGIAYAASLGGIATIIGTPPNSLLVAFVESDVAESYRTTITFSNWLLIGVPVTVLFLPCCWFLLTRVLFPLSRQPVEQGGDLIRSELRSLGTMRRGEKATAIVFALTALTWILRPLLIKIAWSWGDVQVTPLAGLSDAGIAMTGALALFVIPIDLGKRVFTLDWASTRDLPWGILILFGGGLSLAAAVRENHVAEFFGSLSHHFAGMPPIVIVLVVTITVIFLTELTSNAATTATLLPVLAAFAPGMGLHPFMLILPATIAASCAFMMPVATPPNAIVFGSGEVRIAHMAWAGIWLNLIGVVLITLLTMFWFPHVFTMQ